MSSADVSAGDRLPLIPLPVHIETAPGNFALSASTRVVAMDGQGPRDAALHFTRLMRESTGLRLRPTGVTAAFHQPAGAMVFALDPAAPEGDEAYALEVRPDGVRVTARTEAGLFYGGVTLWQLATGNGYDAGGTIRLPAVKIQDAPRFKWRGFMVDSARHPTSIEEIKKLLDQMARHKLNVFHWHLTDDQGWRLQINRYPRLTEVGAWRIPAGEAGHDDQGRPLPYGGFYTQAEAREIVEYARRLHITVVPEIELPGHAQAAIAAYPELGVSGEAPPVSPDWGVHTWLFNVEDDTFTFLENVLTEVMDIFPGQYIHIGGDEADKHQWANSERVQARRRELGLKDDAELQSWFIKRIGAFLSAHDRRLIGWDEILEGGIAPEATVMSWRGLNGAIEAAREGHDVVITPSNTLYLNRMQSMAADEPPSHDYETTLERVYAFEVVPPELTGDEVRHVLGAQANIWTEHVRTAERVEYMVFPRLTAVAERVWSPKETRDWTGFLNRLAPQMRRFESAGIHAADSAFAVRLRAEARGADRAVVSLANQTGFGQVRYTLDGSAPTATSPLYQQPLEVRLPTVVTANAFHDGVAMARPRAERIDARWLRSRDAEGLETCQPGGLVLRLEDDEPREGERAVVPTDIIAPCWRWPNAPVDGVHVLKADIVDLPYNFQLGGAPPAPVPPSSEPVRLQLFARTCDGAPLASAVVPEKQGVVRQVAITLPDDLPTRDLCLKFSVGPRPVLWAIDRVELSPR